MPRTKQIKCNLHKWGKQWMEQVADSTCSGRRNIIGERLGWTLDERKRVCSKRARATMLYMKAQWTDVKHIGIVEGINHQRVFDRIYDWCVYELKPKKAYRSALGQLLDATVFIQSVCRRNKHRHRLNGHLKYSCGGFIFGAYEQRRKPNSYCYSCYAELEFTRSSRPI